MIARDSVFDSDDVDLLLDEGCEDPSGTDCVSGDSKFRVLKGGCLGETNEAMFGSYIGRFVD